jgi:hypothetical protein
MAPLLNVRTPYRPPGGGEGASTGDGAGASTGRVTDVSTSLVGRISARY